MIVSTLLILGMLVDNSHGVYDHTEFVEEIGYKHGRPTFVALARIPGNDLSDKKMFLAVDAREAWVDLLSSAAQAGFYIKVNYAFRTHAQQKKLARTNKKFASIPGWSPHQQGLAIDLNNCTKVVKNKRGKKVVIKTPLFYWLKKNAPRFGFYNTIKYEPWHWEYVAPSENANT